MLFGECPSSRGVVHRRGYHCVEKPKSMSKLLSSRRQLLSILVERCPGSPDTISDFGRLLQLESYHLSKYFVLSSLVNISTLMSSISISYLMFKLWLMRIFVFPEWIPSPTFAVLRLNSHNMFWSCSFEDAKIGERRQQISCL